MRGFAAYLLGGILVVLALDFIAPPAGRGLASAWPAAQNAAPQSVNRANKADRMPVSASTVDKKIEKQTPRQNPVLAGCDPVFSPLSASARANFAARCVA